MAESGPSFLCCSIDLKDRFREKRTFAELFEFVDQVGSYGSAWWLDDTLTNVDVEGRVNLMVWRN